MYYRADVAIDDVVVRVEDQQNCTTFPYNAAPGIYIYCIFYVIYCFYLYLNNGIYTFLFESCRILRNESDKLIISCWFFK